MNSTSPQIQRNPLRLRDSCLISAFPLISGHGAYARLVAELGIFEKLVLFKVRKEDGEAGYDWVLRDRLHLGTPALFLSCYFPSRWGRFVSNSRFVHFTSPHFFHLARYNPNSAGTVHDTIFLDRRTHNWHDTPFGSRFFFPRAMKSVDRLKGVVVPTDSANSELRSRFPKANSRVIHHWTGPEFCPRDKKESRECLGLPTDRKILLHVSIDVARKNLEILPRLAGLLDASYLIARIGDSARIMARFPARRFFAWASLPPTSYPLAFNAADVLLMPSFAEGFGRPIIEALNSMTPVVASDIEVFREILGSSYPFLVNPNDPPAWAEACRAACEISQSSSARATLLGSYGDYYRSGRAFKEMIDFYREIGLFADGGPSS